ncbi:MAG: sulfite exporter TauE/SafE family protein [Proteobacteria bacterium]|nr:sulfite exporter TauE/SafE family protein [Pseudomonadota bacterium]
MHVFDLDLNSVAIVLLGAVVAGFTTGFAGFGTALVASGFWFHALPASSVPPLVTLASVASQIVGLISVRQSFSWGSAWPYLVGGAIGVPLGVLALNSASPTALRMITGTFLIGYSITQSLLRRQRHIGDWGGRPADAAIGLGGGVLGGFAGLSGPLPLIWLQLRGGDIDHQRAIYQPFNLVVLALAFMGMAGSGKVTGQLLGVAVLCLPATLAAAWFGARAYVGVSPAVFRRIILALLFVSGILLLAETVFR